MEKVRLHPQESQLRFRFFEMTLKLIVTYGFEAANEYATKFLTACHRGDASLSKPSDPELLFELRDVYSKTTNKSKKKKTGGKLTGNGNKYCKWHGKNGTHTTANCRNPGAAGARGREAKSSGERKQSG